MPTQDGNKFHLENAPIGGVFQPRQTAQECPVPPAIMNRGFPSPKDETRMSRLSRGDVNQFAL
ncbi:MAG TPA: hypothetical protein VI935_09365 [Thermodesulfobacteriota bacterium]|nr:hypothetical protein [Thermodesulfobacteriota bacterium]